MPSEVQHVALWNHNVEFIDQESAWARPAVFVEFGTMDLTPVKAARFRCTGTLSLHIVTDYDVNDDTSNFGLTDAIIGAVVGYNDNQWRINDVQSIMTNHNHEDLVEEIVTFRYSAAMNFDYNE